MSRVVRISRQRAFRALNLVALSLDTAAMAHIDEPLPPRGRTDGGASDQSR